MFVTKLDMCIRGNYKSANPRTTEIGPTITVTSAHLRISLYKAQARRLLNIQATDIHDPR